jgi:hypothetical protein
VGFSQAPDLSVTFCVLPVFEGGDGHMLLSPFGRTKRVLTIGSVHLDTIVERNSLAANPSPGVSTVVHAIGGSAFNVAAHLVGGRSIKRVYVYTILPKDSVLTDLIIGKFRRAKIETKYVRTVKEFIDRPVKGGGFIELVDAGNKEQNFVGVVNVEQHRPFRLAVIDPVYAVDIFAHRKEASYLRRAIGRADILISDGNLTANTLNHICRTARKKPLFFHFGSEAAASRSWMYSASENNDAVCVAGRSQILGKLLENAGVSAADVQAFRAYVESGTVPLGDTDKFCDALKTRSILSINVQPTKGIALVAKRRNRRPQNFFHPFNIDVQEAIRRNAAGVVDAALAGFIKWYVVFAPKQFDFDDESTKNALGTEIDDRVGKVTHDEGATPGSVI